MDLQIIVERLRIFKLFSIHNAICINILSRTIDFVIEGCLLSVCSRHLIIGDLVNGFLHVLEIHTPFDFFAVIQNVSLKLVNYLFEIANVKCYFAFKLNWSVGLKTHGEIEGGSLLHCDLVLSVINSSAIVSMVQVLSCHSNLA